MNPNANPPCRIASLVAGLLVKYGFLIYSALVFALPNIANAANAAASNDFYRLSSGDKIKIQVFGEDDLTVETSIGDSGRISYPFLGELKLDGLTIHDVEEHITAGLKGPYLRDPKVSVSIIEYRPFYISGEVTKPGGYPYQPGLTTRKAIAIAGGFTAQAAPDSIVIRRENDMHNSSHNSDLDAPIFPGDSITVAEYRRVYVNGEVKNPGGYPYQPGLTLRKAIALAGGFTARAAQDRLYVIRENTRDQEPILTDLDAEIIPGDIVTVKQSFF